ncbi:carboxypeptidase [Phlyctema vagabunda]|uniref:Carboxypeptidase n=1 Tax=Phlyctema vagabunda TaxID=108571 RepID=A0ABR4PBJ5_9HELO
MLLSWLILGLNINVLVQAQGTRYGGNRAVTSLDNALVSANFPDVNVTIYSPAFLGPGLIPAGFSNGTSGPTDDAVLASFIQDIAQTNDWASYHGSEIFSEEGRAIPYLFLSKANTNGSSSKLRIWVQGAAHGNEPASDAAVLALLGRMNVAQKWTSSLLDLIDIIVLPRYNPDGVSTFQRTLATNFDPNRDHLKLVRQQTRDIKKRFSSFAPHIVVDMHEFTATAVGSGLLQATDTQVSAAKNLNIHSAIRNLSEELFTPEIFKNLASAGFRGGPYKTSSSSRSPGRLAFEEAGTDGKIGRNAMGLSQSITFLVETRGIRIANQHFRRRVASGLNVLETILQTAADNHEVVYNTIETAITEFAQSTEDIIVTDYTELSERVFEMISASNGTRYNVSFPWASATPAFANLTRARPSAYIIPPAWADIAALLEVQGLEVSKLSTRYTGYIQALEIASSSLASSYYEGAILNTVTTKSIDKYFVDLPEGSFYVSTAQKNIGIAFNVLEPENIDSFVSFGIIPQEEGDIYPIFRVNE